MSAAPKITALRGEGVSLAVAADAFLATPHTANPHTHRAYALAIDRVTTLLGRDRPLADVTDAEIGAALTEQWGISAPATWCNRAAVTSWLAWCRTKKHWPAPSVPADVERRKESADETRAVAKTTIQRLLSRRDIPLREKTLWRMLYETAARAAEILALNVEDLDLEHCRAPVRSKVGATGWVYWDRGTAHRLPRLPDGSTRTHGPLFCPDAAPSQPAARPPPTSARTPAAPASATTAHASCSPPTPASTCTNYATAPPPTSATPRCRCSSSWARPATRTPAPPCATSNGCRSHRQGHRGPGSPPPYPLIRNFSEWEGTLPLSLVLGLAPSRARERLGRGRGRR
ncbi:site-specific integrase [Nonomuraea ceibae]|uniref:site-specific integrase n=1 Tax=Nonomuraea ceibae TaxID=1935170 RepID=UPI001FE36E37|nr:site-specific integrase [Nonomuraea ceibae]